MLKLDSVDWSSPGRNRYTGTIAKAIRAYTDIPADVRERLVERADKRQYDEIAVIDKNGIRGESHGYINLRQMYFGVATRAEVVKTDNWPIGQVERALVYTEGAYTVIVPLVCGNVARVDRAPLGQVAPAVSEDQRTLAQVQPANKLAVYSVPEPSTLMLIGPALMAMLFMRRRLLRKN